MSLIADVVDEDELTTGQRREGTFFGVYSCGQQLAVGISFLLTGVLVDWFAGLVPGQATQSPETVWRVGLLYGVLPAMLLCMAAALTCRYTLGQARVLTIQAELAKQRSPLTSY
jgi:GPH family glycoside/pentoside/hexuronide:cation symporter